MFARVATLVAVLCVVLLCTSTVTATGAAGLRITELATLKVDDHYVDNATTFAFFRAINHALREAAVHPTESLRHHWSTLGHSDFLDSNFEYQHSEKAALPVAARVRLRVQQRLAKWTSSAMSVLSDSRVKAQLASIVPTVPDGVRSTKADHVISLSSFDLHLIDGVANLDYMFDNGILKDVKCQADQLTISIDRVSFEMQKWGTEVNVYKLSETMQALFHTGASLIVPRTWGCRQDIDNHATVAAFRVTGTVRVRYADKNVAHVDIAALMLDNAQSFLESSDIYVRAATNVEEVAAHALSHPKLHSLFVDEFVSPLPHIQQVVAKELRGHLAAELESNPHDLPEHRNVLHHYMSAFVAAPLNSLRSVPTPCSLQITPQQMYYVIGDKVRVELKCVQEVKANGELLLKLMHETDSSEHATVETWKHDSSSTTFDVEIHSHFTAGDAKFRFNIESNEHYQVAENKLRLPISSHGLSHIDSLTVRIVQHAQGDLQRERVVLKESDHQHLSSNGHPEVDMSTLLLNRKEGTQFSAELVYPQSNVKQVVHSIPLPDLSAMASKEFVTVTWSTTATILSQPDGTKFYATGQSVNIVVATTETSDYTDGQLFFCSRLTFPDLCSNPVRTTPDVISIGPTTQSQWSGSVTIPSTIGTAAVGSFAIPYYFLLCYNFKSAFVANSRTCAMSRLFMIPPTAPFTQWNYNTDTEATTGAIILYQRSCAKINCPDNCASNPMASGCNPTCIACQSSVALKSTLYSSIVCDNCYAVMYAYISQFDLAGFRAPETSQFAFKFSFNGALNIRVTAKLDMQSSYDSGVVNLVPQFSVPSLAFSFSLSVIGEIFATGVFFGVNYRITAGMFAVGNAVFNSGISVTGTMSSTSQAMQPVLNYDMQYTAPTMDMSLSGGLNASVAVIPFAIAKVAVLGINMVAAQVNVAPQLNAKADIRFSPAFASRTSEGPVSSMFFFSFPSDACSKPHLVEYNVNALLQVTAQASVAGNNYNLLSLNFPSDTGVNILSGCLGTLPNSTSTISTKFDVTIVPQSFPNVPSTQSYQSGSSAQKSVIAGIQTNLMSKFSAAIAKGNALGAQITNLAGLKFPLERLGIDPKALASIAEKSIDINSLKAKIYALPALSTSPFAYPGLDANTLLNAAQSALSNLDLPGVLSGACPPTCSQCTSLVACTSCATGFFLSQSTQMCGIAAMCPSGTFGDSTTLTCATCSGGCATCVGQANRCLTCASGYFFSSSSSSCVAAALCPAGTYAETSNSTCVACSSSCATCSGSATTCTGCATGLTLANSQCTACQTGTWPTPSGTACNACPASCSACTSDSVCTACATGFFLNSQSKTCVSATMCPVATFADTPSKTCAACSPSCNTCSASSSSCTACPSGKFLSGNACLDACPAGSFVATGTNICRHCGSTCATCSSATTCTTCAANHFFVTGQEICVSRTGCAAGQFADTSTMSCRACDAGCKTCHSSASACTSCQPNLYLWNSACVETCPAGTVVDAQNPTQCMASQASQSVVSSKLQQIVVPSSSHSLRSACDETCATCTSMAPNACLTCASGYFFSNSYCLTPDKCPTGTYAESTNSSCLGCSSGCAHCYSATECQTCSSGLVLDPSTFTCGATCPQAYYLDASTSSCSACSQECGTCTGSATTCTSCIPDTYLNQTTHACQHTCAAGYYGTASLQCAACSASCSTCAGAADKCTSCPPNTFLNPLNSACVPASGCPAATFSDAVTRTCVTCHDTCLTCTGNKACQTCEAGYFLSNGECVDSMSCANGTFPSATLRACVSCAVSDPLKPFMDPHTGSCVNASLCSAGYYADTASGQCLPCSGGCHTCSSSATTCLSCDADLYLSNHACVAARACPNGTYADPAKICMACADSCATCDSLATTCTSCTGANTYLNMFDGTCVSGAGCPSGTFADPAFRICNFCNDNCATCVTENQCSTCPAHMFLNKLAWTCVSNTTCPAGYFADTETMQCTRCPPGCASCTSATQCTSCMANNFFSNATRSCVASGLCPVGSYSDIPSQTCLACSGTCASCSGSAAQCTSCRSGKYLSIFSFSCVDAGNCPAATFANAARNSCTPCPKNCASCSSADTCSVCQAGTFFDPGQQACVTTCSDTLFANITTRTCQPCSAPCSTCTGSAFSCTGCTPNVALILSPTNYSCVPGCPSGTIMNPATGACVSCPVSCSACEFRNGAQLCTTCASVAGIQYVNSFGICILPGSSNLALLPVQVVTRVAVDTATASNVTWQKAYLNIMATSTNINASRLKVVSVQAGSAIIRTQIGVDPTSPNSAATPMQAASLLQQQMTNVNSSFLTMMQSAGLGAVDPTFTTPLQSSAMCADGSNSFSSANGCPTSSSTAPSTSSTGSDWSSFFAIAQFNNVGMIVGVVGLVVLITNIVWYCSKRCCANKAFVVELPTGKDAPASGGVIAESAIEMESVSVLNINDMFTDHELWKQHEGQPDSSTEPPEEFVQEPEDEISSSD